MFVQRREDCTVHVRVVVEHRRSWGKTVGGRTHQLPYTSLLEHSAGHYPRIRRRHHIPSSQRRIHGVHFDGRQQHRGHIQRDGQRPDDDWPGTTSSTDRRTARQTNDQLHHRRIVAWFSSRVWRRFQHLRASWSEIRGQGATWLWQQ